MRLKGALVIHDRLPEIIQEFGVDYFRQGLREILEREERQILQTVRTQTVPGMYKQMICRPVKYNGAVGRFRPSTTLPDLHHLYLVSDTVSEEKTLNVESVACAALGCVNQMPARD